MRTPQNEHALLIDALSASGLLERMDLGACGAPEGASVPQGTSHKDLRFSARHPLRTPGAERVAARKTHVLFWRTGESSPP
jgi:hypothetical protein